MVVTIGIYRIILVCFHTYCYILVFLGFYRIGGLMGKERANRGQQRYKVFQRRVEILALLDDGATQAMIREKLDLNDVPPSTFQYLVAKLRDAPRAPVVPAAVDDPERQDIPPSALMTPADEVRVAKPSAPVKETQEEPSGEKPKKKPAPKKRKFINAKAEYERKFGKPKTSEFDPKKARDVK